jgi:YD repeat-containing protein
MKLLNRLLTPIVFLLAAALFGTSAFAQIAWVKNLTGNSSKATGTSIAATVPAGGVAAGNSIIVSLAMDPASGTVSCTDTASNTYTLDRDQINGSGTSGVRTVILSAHNVTALVNGNTITCTHPSLAARAVSASEFSGLLASGAKDQATSATGSGTSPNSGNVTTTQADELLIGAIGVEGPSGDTFTPGTSYTTTERRGTSGGGATGNITVNPEYRIVSATNTYAATATLGTSRQWSAAIVTYKAAPPAPPTKLAITSINSGSNPLADTAFPVIVQSQTAGGAPANVSANTNVSLSLKTGSGLLEGNLSGTINAGSSSVTITGVAYRKAESGVVLTASRTSGDNLTAGDSAPFTVNPGTATKLAFTTQPGASTTGTALSGPPTVAVKDPYNNTVTSSTASITVAIGTNPSGGTLSGTTTRSAASGVASFTDLTINLAGNGYTLMASSSGLTGDTSNGFDVTAPVENISLVRSFTPNQLKSSGTSIALTVTNTAVAAGNSIILTLAMDPATGTVSCSDTAGNSYAVDHSVINGSGTSGVRTVVLSAHNVTALAINNTITCSHPSVTARALSGSEFSGLATSAAKDQANSNTGQSTSPSSGNVTATQAVELLIGAIGSEGPGGDLFTPETTYTGLPPIGTTGGNAATNITIFSEYRRVSPTGTYSATGSISSSRKWATAIVTYKAKVVATKLAITSINNGTTPTAGQSFTLVVQARKADNSPALVINPTSFNLSVLSGDPSALSGTTSATIAAGTSQVTVSGVVYSKADQGVILRATQTSGDPVTPGDSTPFTVNAGGATKLAFIHQPTNSTTSGAIKGPPTAAVQDNAGNTITTSTASITIAIGTNPGGGTLSGTTVKNAANGTAAFADLHINNAANGYTLTATSPSLTSATTSTFNITAAGNVAGTVTKAAGGGAITGALVEALQSGVVKGSGATNSSGSYTITGLVPGTYDIRGTAGGFTPQTQTGLTVNSGATTTANFSLAAATPTAGIVYIYDELQRLKSVVDPVGEAATYAYDAVGNLLTITRNNATQTSVIDFNPNSGPIGSTVTIYGTGYSTTPSQNTVMFNGTAATVISSTLTQITANVPAGATTGPIAVTSPAGSASSSTSFTVTGAPTGLPTITSFTPTVGVVGTAITLTGTNFDVDPLKNTVKFNPTIAAVTTSSATTINTSFPAGGHPGEVSVTTQAGTATSSQDFFAVFWPYVVNDVEVAATKRIVVDGPSQSITISTATKIGLLIFDGRLGQKLSLAFTNNTFGGGGVCCTSSYRLYRPDGIEMKTGLVVDTGTVAEFVLPLHGTYTIAVDPTENNTGSVTLTLSEDINYGPITINGASVALSIGRPGQKAYVTVSAAAGQKFNLGVTGNTFGGGSFCCRSSAIVYNPSGGEVANQAMIQADYGINFTAAVSGTYTIYLDPAEMFTGGATYTLSEEFNAGSISSGGSVPVSINRFGQRAYLTFAGTQNSVITLQMTSVSIISSTVSVIKPDDITSIASTSIGISGGQLITNPLPETGTYKILIDPDLAYTGNMTVSMTSSP